MEHSQQWQMCSRIKNLYKAQTQDIQYSTYFYLGAKGGPCETRSGQTEIGILSPQMPRRPMANITMFDVKEDRIHNEKIREMMGHC
eukprot:scaffold2756_cov105-Cylindrotheca_fusiformis.AAC.3